MTSVKWIEGITKLRKGRCQSQRRIIKAGFDVAGSKQVKSAFKVTSYLSTIPDPAAREDEVKGSMCVKLTLTIGVVPLTAKNSRLGLCVDLQLGTWLGRKAPPLPDRGFRLQVPHQANTYCGRKREAQDTAHFCANQQGCHLPLCCMATHCHNISTERNA